MEGSNPFYINGILSAAQQQQQQHQHQQQHQTPDAQGNYNLIPDSLGLLYFYF